MKKEKKIDFEARKLGFFKEFTSKKGEPYFKGSLLLNGRSYEVVLFLKGEPNHRTVFAVLSTNLSNY